VDLQILQIQWLAAPQATAHHREGNDEEHREKTAQGEDLVLLKSTGR